MRILIALIAWVGAIAASIGISTAVANSINPSSNGSSSAGAGAGPTSGPGAGAGPTSGPAVSTAAAPTPVVPSAPVFDPSSVKPAAPQSMFVGSNFRKALAVVSHHIGARANIETTRVAPGDVELMTVGKNSQQRVVTVGADGSYTSVGAGQLSGSAQVYYLSQLGANVPATLAKRIAAGAHVPVSHLQYMLVHTDPASQSFSWRVYPTRPSGIYFQAASANGPIEELGGQRTIVLR